jgi:hypothetical protein
MKIHILIIGIAFKVVGISRKDREATAQREVQR